jgi:hypothetical protein
MGSGEDGEVSFKVARIPTSLPPPPPYLPHLPLPITRRIRCLPQHAEQR